MSPTLQALLPQASLSRLVGRLGRVERPRFIVQLVLRAFARRYAVDLGEAARPLDAYRSFTDFFTRRLRHGARPLPADDAILVWPADGTAAASGTVGHGRLLQAKGIDYSLADLVGDAELARSFDGGAYQTVYLSPRDYHRVHAPWAGRLSRRIHCPGRLFSVSTDTVARVPGVFAGNERVVLVLDDQRLGSWALVLVGALIVGGIETVWEGTVNPLPRGTAIDRRFDDDPPTADRGDIVRGSIVRGNIVRGDEVGLFRAGSTVIALFRKGRVRLDGPPEGHPVQMGTSMGRALGA